MMIRHALALIPLCGVALAAEPPPSYLEISPQRVEELPYHEIPPSPELGSPIKESEFPEIPVDRISDDFEDPKTVYRDMETGAFDREPMVEIAPRALPERQLPAVTVIPADEPAPLPVHTTPAQQVVVVPPGEEEQIFRQLTPAESGVEAVQPIVLPELPRPRSLRRSPVATPPSGGPSISVIEEPGG